MGWILGYRRIPHFIIFYIFLFNQHLFWSDPGRDQLTSMNDFSRCGSRVDCMRGTSAFLAPDKFAESFGVVDLGTVMSLLSLDALSNHGYLIMYLSTR